MRYKRFFVLLLLSLICITLLAGCANPFQQFYAGQTVANLNSGQPMVAVSDAPAEVIPTDNIVVDIESRLEDGMILLGESNWNGADVGSESQARQQAKSVGASLVLWSYQYAGSTSGAMPLTTPTVDTTYGSGTVYGNYGSATWTGSATTYGTKTTYIPYTVHRYNVSSAFFAQRLQPPMLGVYCRRPTPTEQATTGTTTGLIIMLVVRGSPAAEGGLLPGDVICSVGSAKIDTAQEFETIVAKHAGQIVDIAIRRRGQPLTKSVQLNP